MRGVAAKRCGLTHRAMPTAICSLAELARRPLRLGSTEKIIEIALGDSTLRTAILKEEMRQRRAHHPVLIPGRIGSDEGFQALVQNLRDFSLKAYEW